MSSDRIGPLIKHVSVDAEGNRLTLDLRVGSRTHKLEPGTVYQAEIEDVLYQPAQEDRPTVREVIYKALGPSARSAVLGVTTISGLIDRIVYDLEKNGFLNDPSHNH